MHIKHTIENCYIILKNENNTNKMFTFNWTIYKLEKNYILVYIYIFVIIKIKLSRTYFIAKFDFSENLAHIQNKFLTQDYVFIYI